MLPIIKLKEVLSTPQKIIIIPHHKPDADALGSCLGLHNYLLKKGHTSTVISPTDYPAFLSWMKGNDGVIINNDDNSGKINDLFSDSTLIFCLDFSSLNRINDLGEKVKSADAIKVMIDHHRDPEEFADYACHDINSASTAQLIYKTIVEWGDKSLIDKSIAECLYAGIMTDTGSFKHPNTNKEVHLIVAELIGLGANNAEVSRLIYDTNSHERLKFLGYALSERLTVIPEHHAAYFAISADDLKNFHSKTGDTEGLVNYALSIDGITMAALITEREDGVKLSLRSIGDFEVNKLAAKYFNGGGHKNAAGGKSDHDLNGTIELINQLIREYSHQLKNKSTIESYV